MFGSFSALTLLLFGFGYVFFMFKDSDALRSERYSLSKMAIEKGLIGDDIKGLLSADLAENIASKPRLLESTNGSDEH